MGNEDNWRKTLTIILVVAVSVGIYSAIEVDGSNIFSDILFGFFTFCLTTFALSSCFMQADGQGR